MGNQLYKNTWFVKPDHVSPASFTGKDSIKIPYVSACDKSRWWQYSKILHAYSRLKLGLKMRNIG